MLHKIDPMTPLPVVVLKPGKDVPIRAGHPWVFSEAIAEGPEGLEPGELVEVQSRDGDRLGIGTFNPLTSIRVRLITHDVRTQMSDARSAIDAQWFEGKFKSLDAWKRSRLPERTTGYRLVHAETDGIPGLIVDRYGDVFVFQLHTAGMDRLREEIVTALTRAFVPTAIVERSDVEARKQEGLQDRPVAVHVGTIDAPIKFEEHGLTFSADVLKGQKTGFFLDQREARRRVGQLAKDKNVLNLFSYSGAFSVHAAMGGASYVESVDASHPALEAAQEQVRLNGMDPDDESRFAFTEADVIEYLEDPSLAQRAFELIVCDPPAFARHGSKTDEALKAYGALNAACFRLLGPGGILVTSSCSGRVDPDDFRSMLRRAAGRAGRDVRILDVLSQPVDHAERLAFPEGRYLKTAILEVTSVLV